MTPDERASGAPGEEPDDPPDAAVVWLTELFELGYLSETELAEELRVLEQGGGS